MMRFLTLFLFVAFSAGCKLPRKAAATPQRPTVSFDTSTTAQGTVEVEAGVSVDPGDFFDSPVTLKYGTSADTELFVGYSPLQYLDRAGPDADGGSDLVLGTRHRLWQGDDDTPSAAVVLSGKLPTARASNGLGSGQVDVRIGGILNQQFGPVNANVFYQYGALGNPGGGHSSEHTATVTAGWALADRWGAFAELAGIFVPSTKTDSVFTIVGATFTPEPSLVLDAGVTVGLSSDAPDLQVFFGCTHNFGGPARN